MLCESMAARPLSKATKSRVSHSRLQLFVQNRRRHTREKMETAVHMTCAARATQPEMTHQLASYLLTDNIPKTPDRTSDGNNWMFSYARPFRTGTHYFCS